MSTVDDFNLSADSGFLWPEDVEEVVVDDVFSFLPSKTTGIMAAITRRKNFGGEVEKEEEVDEEAVATEEASVSVVDPLEDFFFLRFLRFFDDGDISSSASFGGMDAAAEGD